VTFLLNRNTNYSNHTNDELLRYTPNKAYFRIPSQTQAKNRRINSFDFLFEADDETSLKFNADVGRIPLKNFVFIES
jgi:hypothetical protein